jgi:hypothetical protein
MPDESTPELRCVAPLVVITASGTQLVGPCMLITNGQHTIAIASSEVLRRATEPLHIMTRLDGDKSVQISSWQLARHAAIGIIELGEGVAFTPEVHPLHLASLSATVETRGAPAALIAIVKSGDAFARVVIDVVVELDDGGGMSDEITRVAVPIKPIDAGTLTDGAPLFAWMPPDPVLGRRSEVIALALAVLSRGGTVELIGLEDAGRALPWAEQTPAPSNELGQVAGEIKEK